MMAVKELQALTTTMVVGAELQLLALMAGLSLALVMVATALLLFYQAYQLTMLVAVGVEPLMVALLE